LKMKTKFNFIIRSVTQRVLGCQRSRSPSENQVLGKLNDGSKMPV
jgi:hypothetical protein